ncbi:MAG: Clp protease ClpP [Paraprevotella sp.]|nr:Clp protease ClpP [Paraprevotella sp.]
MAKSTEYQLDVDSYIGYPISKGYVRSKLAAYKNQPVNVRVNSYSGSLNDGLDIRQQFLDHGNVTVYIFGLTASAATILAMGAAKIRMSRYAMFMAHKVSNWVDEWGQMNADQVQQVIDNLTRGKQELDKMDLVCASIYAQKCGRPVEELLDFLKEGRWINAEEALNMGLIDEIIEDGEKPAMTAEVREHFLALGMPVPYLAEPKDKTGEERGFFDGLLSRFSTYLSSKDTNPQKDNDMKKETKTCAQVCKALGMRGNELELQSQACALTSEQLDMLENHLKGLQDKVDSLEHENGELAQQVENLKKGDGDDTEQVEGTVTDDTAGESAAEWFNKFEDII